MVAGKAISFLAAVCTAFVCLPAVAAGPTIPPDPTLADKRAFVSTTLQYIEKYGKYKIGVRDVPEEHREDIPICTGLAAEVQKGNFTFLEPAAFDRSQKPPEVLAIEKRCPNLILGLQFREDHDADKDLNSEQDWIKEYGEPSRPMRNFTLYRIPLPNSKVMPVYFADTLCSSDVPCGKAVPDFELIDTGECWTERRTALQPGPNALSSLVTINQDTYILEADTGGTYGSITLSKLPADIVPTRPTGEWLLCSIEAQIPIK